MAKMYGKRLRWHQNVLSVASSRTSRERGTPPPAPPGRYMRLRGAIPCGTTTEIEKQSFETCYAPALHYIPTNHPGKAGAKKQHLSRIPTASLNFPLVFVKSETRLILISFSPVAVLQIFSVYYGRLHWPPPGRICDRPPYAYNVDCARQVHEINRTPQ